MHFSSICGRNSSVHLPIKIIQAGPFYLSRQGKQRLTSYTRNHKSRKYFWHLWYLGWNSHLAEVNTKMPIKLKRARISLSDSSNSLSLLWLGMEDWDSQVGSTIHSWMRKIGQIQQYCRPCKTCLHQAWTEPNILPCSTALNNSCSWICDLHSHWYCGKTWAGSTIFLDGIYSRGTELLGCQIKRILGLEEKRTSRRPVLKQNVDQDIIVP